MRSVLALHLLVLFRLLLYAVPMRRDCSRRNMALRRSRGLLRGAPFLLLLAWFAPVASAMQPDSRVRPLVAEGLPANPVNWPAPDARHAASCGGNEDVSADVSPAGTATGSRATVSVPDFDGNARLPPPVTAEERWFLPVIGLRYQKPHSWTSCRGDTADEESLFEAAEAQFCVDTPECHVVVVHPQPHVMAPTFLVVLPCASYVDCVPVCLQIYNRGSQPGISMEYLPAMSFLPDIIAFLPDEAKLGVQIFVGDRSAPLSEYDTVHVCPGLLIRAYPSTILNPRRALSLSVRLTRAWEEFADLDVEGPVVPDYSLFVVGVLEPAELPRTFPMLEGTLEDFGLGVSRFLNRPRERFRLLEPLVEAPALAILGIPVSRLFGVVPADCAQWIPVFVDPREVAQHLRLVLLPPVPLTVTDFLYYSHVRIPDGYEPRILGLGARQECPPRMQFRHREVISVQAVVAVRASDPEPESFFCDPESDEAPTPGRRQPGSPAWTQGGCAPAQCPTRTASASSGQTSFSGPAGRTSAGQRAGNMWNWGFSVTPALPSRLLEDTSIAQAASPAVHPQRLVLNELLRNFIWRQDCLLQTCWSRLTSAPVV